VMASAKAPRRSVEAELADLAQAMGDPRSDLAQERLRIAFRQGRALVVARAATLARQHRAVALVPELKEAFARFLRDPVKSDPSCHAKLAALEALDALEDMDVTPFLTGARHVQKEAAWGPPVDTAVGV